MTPRKLIVVGLAGALAASACKRASRGPGLPAAGPLWEPGAHYAYDVRLTSKTELDAGRVLLDLRITGALDLHVGSSEGGVVALTARLHDVRLEGTSADGRANLDQLARELERPWRLSIRDGRVEELGLPRGSSAATAGIERTLGASLQFSPGAGGQGTWTAAEHDATGRYIAEYHAQAQAGHFTKRKLRYETLLVAAAGVRPELRLAGVSSAPPEVVASRSEIEIADGRLRTAQGDEELRANIGAGVPVSSKTSLSLSLRAADRSPASDVAGGELFSLRAGESYAPAAPPLKVDAAKTAGWIFERAIAELEALDRERPPAAPPPAGDGMQPQDPQERVRAQKMAAAFMALSALLREDPRNIRRATVLARKNGAVAHAILDALSSAGTAPGQAALLALAVDGTLPRELRQAAAGSLIRTSSPSEETVSGLVPLVTDPLLEEYAVYGLGTFARKLREAGQAQRSDRISALLLQRLGADPSAGSKVTLLRGIANSGYAGALSAVRPYLASENPSLRAAAVQALRLMDSPAIDSLIADRLEHDELPQVRYAAFGAVAPRRVTPILATAVERAAVAAPDAHGRLQATRLLARWLPDHEDVRPTLEKVAARDAEPKVRDEARRALGRI